ncbi:hypothetical protein OH77DRAFT_206343 [Trametes cingulata]|nr:hypothetical protein OH77DRAFT_206343 [Trametes cingulata]
MIAQPSSEQGALVPSTYTRRPKWMIVVLLLADTMQVTNARTPFAHARRVGSARPRSARPRFALPLSLPFRRDARNCLFPEFLFRQRDGPRGYHLPCEPRWCPRLPADASQTQGLARWCGEGATKVLASLRVSIGTHPSRYPKGRTVSLTNASSPCRAGDHLSYVRLRRQKATLRAAGLPRTWADSQVRCLEACYPRSQSLPLRIGQRGTMRQHASARRRYAGFRTQVSHYSVGLDSAAESLLPHSRASQRPSGQTVVISSRAVCTHPPRARDESASAPPTTRDHRVPLGRPGAIAPLW